MNGNRSRNYRWSKDHILEKYGLNGSMRGTEWTQ